MPCIDRQNEIIKLVEQQKRISVKRLSKILYASEPTIRRDLNALSQSGLVVKIHGGAEVASCAPDKKIPQVERMNEQHSAKSIMAKKAAALIRDSDIIMMDASTSASFIIPYLTKFKDLIVITSGAKSVVALAENNIRCYSTGGQLLNDCFSFIGEEAKRMVSSFNADLFFFSCRGLSNDGRLTDISIEEDHLRQEMMAHAKKKVFLCDSSKFGKTYFHNVCSLREVDVLICDTDASIADFHK